MAPEATQTTEIFLDGVAPTIETITSLPQGKSLRVWDSERGQMAFVLRDPEGRLKIRTGDLSARTPEVYDIEPAYALADALELWKRAKEGEARQQQNLIESGPF